MFTTVVKYLNCWSDQNISSFFFWFKFSPPPCFPPTATFLLWYRFRERSRCSIMYISTYLRIQSHRSRLGRGNARSTNICFQFCVPVMGCVIEIYALPYKCVNSKLMQTDIRLGEGVLFSLSLLVCLSVLVSLHVNDIYGITGLEWSRLRCRL